MILEVIALTVQDVEDAVRLGADRIELVTGIPEGGLTPSLGLVEAAVHASTKPVHVMLRPHSRTFCYDPSDVEVIMSDLRHIRGTGAAGIVFGALTEGRQADLALLQAVIAELGTLDLTFHRAFDECEDRLQALQALSQYSAVRRILTSGGPAPAPQAIPEISALVSASRGSHLRIMGGHGLSPDNIAAFVSGTGVAEVHFGSAVREGGSYANRIDPARMRQVRDALDSLQER